MAANFLLCDARLSGCTVRTPRAGSKRIGNAFVVCPGCHLILARYELQIRDKLLELRVTLCELVAAWIADAQATGRILTPQAIEERLDRELFAELDCRRTAAAVRKMVGTVRPLRPAA